MIGSAASHASGTIETSGGPTSDTTRTPTATREEVPVTLFDYVNAHPWWSLIYLVVIVTGASSIGPLWRSK